LLYPVELRDRWVGAGLLIPRGMALDACPIDCRV
jgi:hypothetical protein